MMRQNFNKKIVCTLLVISCFVFMVPTAQVHAQATGVSCAVGSYLSSVISGYLSDLFGGAGGSAVTVNEAKLRLKEFTLDRLATCAAKEILHKMTASTVDWINSGFQGSPAYVTNPKAFFLDAADQVTGAFLATNGPLNKLCSPWSVDIRLSLALRQAGRSSAGVDRSRYYCTLSTIINNAKNTGVNVNGRRAGSVQGFLDGDFSQGGWDAFLSLTTDDRNQPFSLYLNALGDQEAVIADKKSQLSADLLQGHGFMSWTNCKALSGSELAAVNAAAANDEDYLQDMGYQKDASGTIKSCSIETPGSAIAQVLYPQLNTGRDELQLADNINSVVNALMNQLTNQMFTSGLRALSSGGSGTRAGAGGTNAAYLSQIVNDARGAANAMQTQTNAIVKTYYDNAVSALSYSKNNLLGAKACYTSKLNNGTLSAANMALATNQITGIDNLILIMIDPALATLNSKSTQAMAGAITLQTAQQDLTDTQTQATGYDTQANSLMLDCSRL